MNKNADQRIARAEAARLISPGVLGFYTHLEATEIFAIGPGDTRPMNVFTILVAEDRSGSGPQPMTYLSAKPIRLKGLRDWSFGVVQYTIPIADLVPILEGLEIGNWLASGKPLRIGELESIPIQFVPPDSIGEIAWNRMLKNNFWNGSYILEWFDSRKTMLQPLFDDPPRLHDLSQAIREYLPLGLASLSDRLGCIVVQLPVKVLVARFRALQNPGGFQVDIAWHPKATPRALRATYELEFDGLISGYVSSNAEAPGTGLPMQSGPGLYRGVIWDEQHRIALAATGPSGFIRSIPVTINAIDPEPRVFMLRDEQGCTKQQRVALVHKSVVVAGKPDIDRDWTRRRMYRDEVSQLVTARRFVQYDPRGGHQHEKALADIRHLINQYGDTGAWLWDPYLSARDMLETLFHCVYVNADLRALTACQELGRSGGKKSFVERQRIEIAEAQCNMRGLRAEYRASIGKAGWQFHDRFLIFPKADRAALAWSLGTSVNSLGIGHHILQRVDDGQLVMDAFIDLWDRLNRPEHRIWKTP